MEQSNIISTAMKIHQITNLNTYVLDRNKEIVYHREVISIPVYMPGSDEEDILYVNERMNEQDQLYSYINEWDLHYLGYKFIYKGEATAIIIGPYFDKTPDLYSLSREYDLSSIQSEDLRAVCDKIYVLTTEHANSFASVLQQFKAMIDQEMRPKIIVSDRSKCAIQTKVDNFNMDEEVELVKLRYKTEKDFMQAVEQGDKATALKLINSSNMLFYFSNRFPNQPLRRQKNLEIILGTLLRTSARNSHVPDILIHRISEKYAYDIENANQLVALYQIEDRMIAEYCDLVISNSLRNYSTMTQRIIEHLLSFYDKQIDKEELAALLSTHPSHLSRKFKEETKMTITAYQQMLRIKQAKHLLKTDTLSIEEISWIIGYNDPSYFARVFKKETGKTPSQYREGEHFGHPE